MLSTGSANDLLPDGTKPLPWPKSTNHQWDFIIFVLGQYFGKCWRYVFLIWALNHYFKITTAFPRAQTHQKQYSTNPLQDGLYCTAFCCDFKSHIKNKILKISQPIAWVDISSGALYMRYSGQIAVTCDYRKATLSSGNWISKQCQVGKLVPHQQCHTSVICVWNFSHLCGFSKK